MLVPGARLPKRLVDHHFPDDACVPRPASGEQADLERDAAQALVAGGAAGARDFAVQGGGTPTD